MKKILIIAIAFASMTSAVFAAGKPSDNARPGTDGTDDPGAVVGGTYHGPNKDR